MVSIYVIEVGYLIQWKSTVRMNNDAVWLFRSYDYYMEAMV